MSAKQGSSGNRIKKLCLYGIFTALCLVFGYIESLIPTNAIAPGIKLGLSNAVALMLISLKDLKGAFFVNVTRILLSALLFGSVFSLLFSFCGGVVSVIVSMLLSKTERFSPVGVGIVGGIVHNIVQLFVASVITGNGVWWYAPVLFLGGTVSGAVIGTLCAIILKRLNKSNIKAI